MCLELREVPWNAHRSSGIHQDAFARFQGVRSNNLSLRGRKQLGYSKTRTASRLRESRSSRHGGICSASGNLSLHPADELTLYAIRGYPTYPTPLQIEPSRAWRFTGPDMAEKGDEVLVEVE
jgi:hypothetical protein